MISQTYSANKPPTLMPKITNGVLRSNLSHVHTLLTANHSGTLTTCEVFLKINNGLQNINKPRVFC